MKKILQIVLLLTVSILASENFKPWKTQIKKLSSFEKYVMIDKGTERAFSGKYVYTKKEGVYVCKLCGKALYHSKDKFVPHCGWPSFDDAIKGAIKETPDKDGFRTEISCANCGAHMGHIFKGEHYTPKNVRHCVNSASLTFKKPSSNTLKKAYFAGGCFWGVEYYLEKLKGVKNVTSGFMGGSVKNPTYHAVSYTNTGHLETVEVIYNPNKISYERLAKMFFEIHDPTQINGQGPDIGSQYLSAIFVQTPKERKTVNKLIKILEKKGLKIATKILKKTPFYSAENYHQNHYRKKGGTPYCHRRVKRF